MEKFRFIAKQRINKLPASSGVYLFYKNNQKPIYIGKATNMRERAKNHFQQPSYRDNLFINQIKKVGYLETNSEIEALILEANLIKKFQPKYNVTWRDDKNYFYVCVAQNKQGLYYVFVTHQPKKSQIPRPKGYPEFQINSNLKFSNPKNVFIGPFTEGIALKKTLRFLRRALPYYTRAKHPKIKCTWCHLGLCPGPRLFESANLSAEYKRNIKKLILILQGKRDLVLKFLKKEMKQLSREKKFEQAARARDKIYNLQQIMAHTKVINAQSLTPSAQTANEILAKIIGAKNSINRIEAYDVSNIQGKMATGSMIVFIEGLPDKSRYKRFKINAPAQPNDIAMLREVLTRRFFHLEWGWPNAILIDGGRAQLNIAIMTKKRETATKPIKILALAKGRQELFIEGKHKPIALKSLPQEVYNLIKQLDDEAHRFAIAYHKKLHLKQSLL